MVGNGVTGTHSASITEGNMVTIKSVVTSVAMAAVVIKVRTATIATSVI